MHELGKLIFIAGVVLAVIGLLLWKAGGLGPIGLLPGDISIQRPGFSFYFPIATCVIVSIVLTFLMWLFRR